MTDTRETTKDYELEQYVISAELVQKLKAENGRLRRALQSIADGTEDENPPYRIIDFQQAKHIAAKALAN